MTTLSTGLPISSRASETKITPSLRLAVQKATSVFQKDFCYDFIQAIVDEPEIADPVGVRLFLNFCLRKPDNLVDSFLDSIDQNLGSADSFSETAETILNEIENFTEFVHGLIEMIDGGEIFKLAYHEIDAWKLCYKLLEPVQHRLFDLAVQDRQHFTNQSRDSDPNSEPYELTFASESSNSGFYQAFVTIDKFLKHSFESRILLEPAKLVEDAAQLSERRTELQTFRAMFPSTPNSTLLAKKHGRFGREEATIEQFLESDKFKELSKLKSTMSGGQLTRQPSTRTKKTSSQPINTEKDSSTASEIGSRLKHTNVESASKNKRAISTNNDDFHSADLDPFLRESPAPSKRSMNKRAIESDSDSDSGIGGNHKKSSHKPVSKADSNSSVRKHGSRLSHGGSTTAGTPTTSATTKRKRNSRPGNSTEKDSSVNSSTTNLKRRKSKKGKSSKDNDKEDDEEELFTVEKIIDENTDVNGEVIYKVLWAGYPESEATWQFANTLDDCAALDIWIQNKEAKKLEEKIEAKPDEVKLDEPVEMKEENGIKNVAVEAVNGNGNHAPVLEIDPSFT